MLNSHRLYTFALACALSGIAAVMSPVAQAATFLVVNGDAPGEGFNDTTPATPVGGNTGTTIGQQRLIAFQFAADIWAARLQSNVTIRVNAHFDVQTCSATGAVLGSAGPTQFFRDFTGAPHASTWYPVALANALFGSDLNTGLDDINATFNSAIGTTCAFPNVWYYGLDGNPPGNDIDFVTVLTHELGHGLGFLSAVNLASGTKFLGFDDTFMLNLERHGATPPDYPSMTDAQRVAASTDTGNLHWVGPKVMAASGVLTGGRVGNHVRMFAPSPAQAGSSVSHWDTVLTPNQIMEPNYTGPLHVPGLELALFQDIGWTLAQHTVRDFDRDGKSDILWRHTDGSNAIWEMNGATAKAKLNLSPDVGTSWSIVGTGDTDGDGQVDILWRNIDGRAVVWKMNGAVLDSSSTIGSASSSWKIVGVGDVDGDGNADLVWHHTNGSVAVWELNGAAVKNAFTLGKVDTSWSIVGVGDVDADGKADLVWHNTDGTAAVWELNGGTVKAKLVVGSADTSWNIVAVGDVDGDGKADLIWHNTNGTAAIWELNGGAVKDADTIGKVSTAWQIVSAGDYDGDGKADLLWHHTTGKVAIWEMNGTSVKDQLNVGTVSPSWKIIK